MSQAELQAVLNLLNRIIVGKPQVIRLALTCLLGRGHLLMEDLPGMGKTTLAQALARVLGLQFQRIQFTADLLPADILGSSIFNRGDNKFEFHPGPVFTQVLLADEVNRATPKTQSALLEAMAEQQVTVEGATRALPQPFFVIATQNPLHQIGTYPLPESQLDRFLMRLAVGYPDIKAERELLRGEDRQQLLTTLKTQVSAAQLMAWQQAVEQVKVSDTLLDYVQLLLTATRTGSVFLHGLSPRAGLALLRAARAYAFVNGRDHVLPDDVQAVFVPVAAHRLWLRDAREEHSERAVLELLKSVPVPM
ncbi:AAA family ATPase [Permianibacter sp. IMCC34836]|uniref:AAA family ATPase n=1 Tax=Permianibacter fluminis TaxID=2738515 RepID=UPI0015522A7C|nr:AAA family ATPase [Permianibacter fluminis]NQD38670.1 AAA family ATPase [Permianibacter fluminis]